MNRRLSINEDFPLRSRFETGIDTTLVERGCRFFKREEVGGKHALKIVYGQAITRMTGPVEHNEDFSLNSGSD